MKMPRCVFCGEDTILQGHSEHRNRHVYCENCNACGPDATADLFAISKYRAACIERDDRRDKFIIAALSSGLRPIDAIETADQLIKKLDEGN